MIRAETDGRLVTVRAIIESADLAPNSQAPVSTTQLREPLRRCVILQLRAPCNDFVILHRLFVGKRRVVAHLFCL
jgi:hypothetical protein